MTESGSAHLSTRQKARKRAVDILFAADLRGLDPTAVLADDAARGEVRDYTAELVRGVAANQDPIDARIAACLTGGWTLARMPRVDRAIARVALYELDHTGLDTRIVIAEAVGSATELSTDESPAYLNGLLGRAAADRP